MHKISEEEALSLVSRPTFCEDIRYWEPKKMLPGVQYTGGGLIDENGIGTQLYVELVFGSSHKTNIKTYQFTVFKSHTYGKERVYQLEIKQLPKISKTEHQRSHEHMGDRRTVGDAAWRQWGYDEVLAYFCQRTNVTFRPHPSDPEEFKLRGNR